MPNLLILFGIKVFPLITKVFSIITNVFPLVTKVFPSVTYDFPWVTDKSVTDTDTDTDIQTDGRTLYFLVLDIVQYM